MIAKLMILAALMFNSVYGQTLVTLTILTPQECKPIYGPGCEQITPVSVDATNRGTEPFEISKATVRAVMVSKGIPAIDDSMAFMILRQRLKDEAWGKAARYLTFPPLRIGMIALATWLGSPTWGLTAAGAYEMLDQGAERAAARAPNTEAAIDAITEPHITIMPGAAESMVVFTSAQFSRDLPWERRVVYEWLVDGIPVPANKSAPVPAETQPAPTAAPLPPKTTGESQAALIPPELAGLIETIDIRHPSSREDMLWIAEYYRSLRNEAEAEAVLTGGYVIQTEAR
jgi:hypothetical protein